GRVRDAELELALGVHRPHVERPARRLLEVVRLDLAHERRVDRQLLDALGELAEVAARLLDPLLLRALQLVLETAPRREVDAQPGEADDRGDHQHGARADRELEDQLLLGLHHDLPFDSRIRTGASASVTSAPAATTPKAASDRPKSSPERPSGAPETRPSAVSRSPPARIAQAPASMAAPHGTAASAHSLRRRCAGLTPATRASTRSSPSA